MHEWQKERLTSSDQINDYLDRHISKIRFQDAGMPDRLNVGIGTYNHLTGEILAAHNIQEKLVLLIIATIVGDCLEWGNLNVYYPYNKHKLGHMAMKCGLAYAFHNDCSKIKINNVQSDGHRFWPLFGATPIHGIDEFTERLLNATEKDKDQLTASDYRLLKLIQHHSIKKPKGAFQDFAQVKIELKNGHDFKEQILRPTCYGNDLEIDLYDLNTQRILEDRVGPIPPFPTRRLQKTQHNTHKHTFG